MTCSCALACTACTPLEAEASYSNVYAKLQSGTPVTRLRGQSNGAAGIRNNAMAQPVIAFDVWPKRAAASVGAAGGGGAGGGRGGGGGRRRVAGGGKASASRRTWGSDDSADE